MNDNFQIPNLGQASVSYDAGQMNKTFRNIELMMNSLRTPGKINVTYPAYTPITVAGLPTNAKTGWVGYASDGRKNGEGSGSGTGVLVFFDGTSWIACDSGQPVSA